jgi:hypothetical protein
MSETKQTPVDPLKSANRIVNLTVPLLGLLGLAGGIAQAVRGAPTANVAASVVGAITLLGVSVMNLASPPRDQPERSLSLAVLAVLVVAGCGFTIWFAFQ